MEGRERRKWRGGEGVQTNLLQERREGSGGEGEEEVEGWGGSTNVCTPDKNPNTFPSQTVENR